MIDFLKDNKKTIIIVLCVLLTLATIAVLVVGPARISVWWDNYRSSSYGSDWMVIEHSATGEIIHYWELHGKTICNEQNSDGIYFTDNTGNVIHLSGFYKYIEIKDGAWEEARIQYLKKG